MCPIIIYNFLPVHCVDYVENQSVSKICQDSGFDTDDIRTFVSGQQTLEQISYVTFVGQCSGNLDNGETCATVPIFYDYKKNLWLSWST